ncbi:branched-chain amino acid ABC transporter permease [Bradyrhizobium tropiciagri]|uniref:branched-chain amino acid ABC transporter permease n=1 Tax=Bradyrhizobium tropiciagri TaxID=312253 RepID=UPI001BA7F1E4|nr:branched-chain amino acid ABC transporter permease [Bradyrhizobium tropiciagri]MBR0899181.1 branched-chain amino acid ABC transporter permease [Bradyrhizobium tropiciagri]
MRDTAAIPLNMTPTVAQPRAIWILPILGFIVLVVIPSMPWWASPGTMRWMVELSCYLAVAQMWNLLAGYGGLVSVGQQAFIGIAGYALFILSIRFGINPFVGVALAVIAPALVAVPTYALLHRLDGPYFAIGTWVIAESFRLLTTNMDFVNGGAGLTLRAMTQFSAQERAIGMTSWSAALILITVGGSYWLLRSRYGLALAAMRDNAIAAESQGVNVKRLRFLIYVAAAAGTGLAGAVYYMAQLRISPVAAYSPKWASVCIFIVMVGGIGSIEGVLIGALIYFASDRLFGEYGTTYLIVLGIITLLVAIFARGGVWGVVSRYVGVSIFSTRRIFARGDA